MTRTEVIKAIAYRLGNVRGQEDAIGTELDIIIEDLENEVFHPWFLLSENNVYRGEGKTHRVPVPSNFLMEYEEGSLYIGMEDGSWKPLTKATQEEVDCLDGLGTPTHYTLANGYFRLFPTSEFEFEVEMIYYGRTTGMSPNENPWYKEASRLLINSVCVTMLEARRDKRSAGFAQQAQQAKMILVMKDEERKTVNQEYIFGG